MEETSINKALIKRSKKKKATLIENSKPKKIQIQIKRSNSEHLNRTNKSLLEPISIINLITKGPSINKLFIKNENISIKSESMPKANKKLVKKYRSINIDKGKNEIINNIILTKKINPIQKGSNNTLNYLNMDCIEKVHNLRGIAKDFVTNNNMGTFKKTKKPNYIIKNNISNDKLATFNNIPNRNPIFDFYQPLKEKEIQKKKIQKIQSVNQEKKQYKFSDFKVNKNAKEEDDDDESYGHINPDDYREGNNIEFITGSSLSEENEVSSSLSSVDENNNKKQNKEKKRKKSDKLSNLVNKSFKNKNSIKKERNSSLNYLNSNNNSEIEDNYFKNDTKFFMSPKVISHHTSNKSLKSDAKSDYFNNVLAYFNDTSSNNDINKNSFLGGLVNKSKIKKIESLATNSNNDYEGDNEDEYDIVDIGNQYNQSLDSNKLVNNLAVNDSFNNQKKTDISQNYILNSLNSDNKINILINKNNHQNDYLDNNKIIKKNLNNKENYNLQDNNKIIQKINVINNNNTNFNNINNNINNNIINQNNYNEFSGNKLSMNPNQSNIINIHNMNNFNNNNFIFGNGNSGINPNQINSNLNNTLNNSMNNRIRKSSENSINNNISQNNIIPDSSAYIFNNNLYNLQSNNRINDSVFNMNNYIINNNNQIPSYNLNQLILHNKLMNENNNEYINYDLNTNSNRFIRSNSSYIQQHSNNININLNDNLRKSFNNNHNNINNSINNSYYHSNNSYNTSNTSENQNNNININYLNYYNLQKNLNNIYNDNNQFRYNSERKNQKNINNFHNQNLLTQNMININNSNINTQNYLNTLQYNNYMNLNNNMNFNNNINLNNNMNIINNPHMNNPMIPNNININSNITNMQNNNINTSNNNIGPNNNYQIINGIPNINNIMVNNNINKNQNKHNNFSSNKHKKQNLNLLSNEELAKQAYNLAKYQNGCRYLQKRIENNQKLVPTLFFPNILGHIQELSNDQFGNYYIKIIIRYLPEDMIYKLISLIHPSLSKIGTNQYGTKVIQYLIDFLTNEKNLLFFIEKILPHIVSLINDLNGVHIVQKLISIKNNYIQLVYNKIFSNIQLIAITRDGSNFIKKLIEILDENNMTLLINAINDNLAIIITNQFGNYIIQNIIIKENLRLKFIIIETIIKNIVSFSNQKFSSNVVEKCFEIYEMKDKVIDELLKNNNFEQILLNEFGNYVIQKALFKSDQNRQNLMFKLLIPLINKLQCLPFGQKLLSKLFIQYPRLSIYILNSEEQL